jgi:D-alanyl-lipoteichoic acid acyltransferase DltB (MBOAT superfamily)
LTQYITSYLYSPLQFWISARRQDQGKKVSRKAQATLEGFTSMIAFPMIFTMFIAGVWHGAGMQFLIFGVLHGIYLTVNHAWRLFRPKKQEQVEASRSSFSSTFRRACSILLTFLCVLVAQTFFRATSSSRAVSLLGGMTGLHRLGTKFFPHETVSAAAGDVLVMLVGFFIVWALPNTQQILREFKPSLHITAWDEVVSAPRVRWMPTVAWSLGLGCVLFVVLVRLQDPSTFLYFQF